MKKNQAEGQLQSIKAHAAVNTRIHPQILKALKTMAAERGTTVYGEVNEFVLAGLKRRKAAPASWKV